MKLNLNIANRGILIMEDKNINFEKALESLEKTVALLENGECTLDESIELFENGMKDINRCRTALKNAQNKIISLTEAEQTSD